MIKYYLGVTGLVWFMYVLSSLFNQFVYKRSLEIEPISRNEKIQSFIKFAVLSFVPVLRLTLIWSAYKLLTVNDEELQEIINRLKK